MKKRMMIPLVALFVVLALFFVSMAIGVYPPDIFRQGTFVVKTVQLPQHSAGVYQKFGSDFYTTYIVICGDEGKYVEVVDGDDARMWTQDVKVSQNSDGVSFVLRGVRHDVPNLVISEAEYYSYDTSEIPWNSLCPGK